MNIKKIADDGFSLGKHKNHELDIALLSLKVGLKAYLSTYEKVRRNFWVIVSRENEYNLDVSREKIHIENYAEAYMETIFHFHHFIAIGSLMF